MVSALERIALISRVKDNWDGYGASAISGIVTMNAKKFVSVLYNNGFTIDGEDISATPYGSIEIDIHKNNDLISIEIGKESIGWFTVINNEHIKEYTSHDKGVHTDFNSIPAKLKEALQHLEKENS